MPSPTTGQLVPAQHCSIEWHTLAKNKTEGGRHTHIDGHTIEIQKSESQIQNSEFRNLNSESHFSQCMQPYANLQFRIQNSEIQKSEFEIQKSEFAMCGCIVEQLHRMITLYTFKHQTR